MGDTTTRAGSRGTLTAPRGGYWAPLAALDSRPLLLVAGLILATALVYTPSSLALGQLWSDWHDRSYSHGFLILATSAWLLVRDRARLDAAFVEPESRALPVLLIASAAWLFSWRAALQDAHLLLLPVLALLAILSAFGWSVARIAAFPLLFLGFAMPIWGDMRGPLQFLSSEAVRGLIWVTGLPAIMDGNIIQLPAGSLEIAEGCAGVNFLMVGLAMAVLYGEVIRDPIRRRLVWVALMGVLALVANWTRIFLIALIAYRTQMRSSLVANHYWFGWVIFAIFFAGFLWLAGRYSTPSQPKGRQAKGSTDGTPADSFVSDRRIGSPLLVTLICLAALPLLAYGDDSLRVVERPGVAIDWPVSTSGWHVSWTDSLASARPFGQGAAFQDWNPTYPAATVASGRRYVDAAGVPVEIFVAAYRAQRQGAKLVGYADSLLGSTGDEEGDGSQSADRMNLQLVSSHVEDSDSGRWREMVVRDSAGDESLIWARYEIGSRRFVRPRLSQLWYGIAAFVTNPVSSVTALRAQCVPTCEAARHRLAAATHLLPTVSPAVLRKRGR